jgi:hypothetical protein
MSRSHASDGRKHHLHSGRHLWSRRGNRALPLTRLVVGAVSSMVVVTAGLASPVPGSVRHACGVHKPDRAGDQRFCIA